MSTHFDVYYELGVGKSRNSKSQPDVNTRQFMMSGIVPPKQHSLEPGVRQKKNELNVYTTAY